MDAMGNMVHLKMAPWFMGDSGCGNHYVFRFHVFLKPSFFVSSLTGDHYMGPIWGTFKLDANVAEVIFRDFPYNSAACLGW